MEAEPLDLAREPQLVQEAPEVGFTSDVAAGTGAAAIITYPAVGDGWAHVVKQAIVSYATTPTGGNLQVADGADVIANVDIPAAGVFDITFAFPKQGTPGRAMTITLASGGGAVPGKITVAHKVRSNMPLAGLDYSLEDNSVFMAVD
jgi:hypothetical protein